MLASSTSKLWTLGVVALALFAFALGSAMPSHSTLAIGGGAAGSSPGTAAPAATPTVASPSSASTAKALAILNNVPASGYGPVGGAGSTPSTVRVGSTPPSSQFEYPPRLGATPTELRVAKEQGHITPLYNATPAPTGLADFGLRTNSAGTVVPYVLNTSSLYASLDATNLVPNELYSSNPQYYGLQLNAVSTNVTVLGTPGNSYWAQDVFHYNAYDHTATLVTNLWNFTSATTSALGSNLFYSYGPLGSYLSADTYGASKVICCVTFPYQVQLYLNSSVTAQGRNVIDFTANVESPDGTYREQNWDYVVFNSTTKGGPPVTVASPFTADGNSYNAINLTNDFEAVLIGPSGGDSTDFIGADATLSLQFWNATIGSYESIPSAMAYGGETGETSYGLSEAWTSGSGGPGGAANWAVLSTGGSELKGLWNASTPEGATPVTLSITPSNALVFLNQSGNATTLNEAAWAPTTLDGGSYVLSPGTYTLTVALSYYAPETATLVVPATGTVDETITLSGDPSLGVYVPIYVWNNDQFSAISSSGAGTESSPWMIEDSQSAPMPAIFGQMNDFGVPVFPGVWFYETTAWAELYQPGSFQTDVPPYYCVLDSNANCLPGTNDLAYNFYNTSHVAIVGAKDISGWYANYGGAATSSYGFYATASIIFWNSSDNLVADNVFNVQTEGIYLYGGSSNYIWGNYLNSGTLVDPYGILFPVAYATGIMSGEGGDTIYNNVFNVSEPALLLYYNIYTGASASYTDAWNVPLESAAQVNYAPSWPNFPLTGVIFGTALDHAVDQGGNYWWNYGWSAANPYNPVGVLPYDDVCGIFAYSNGEEAPCILGGGGDYYPLLPISGYTVTFTESGLPAGTLWSVALDSQTNSTTGAANVFLQETSGSYTYVVTGPRGYTTTAGSGILTITSPVDQTITFVATLPSTGTIQGVITPATAAVSIGGTSVPVGAGGVFNTTATAGLVSIEAVDTGYYPYFNNVTLSGGTTTALAITLDPLAPVTAANGTLDGTVTPSTAQVTINGQAVAVGSYGAFTLTLAPGQYTVVAQASGYETGTAVATVVSGRSTSVPALLLTQLPSSSNATTSSSTGGISTEGWAIIGALAVVAAALAVLVVVSRRRSDGAKAPEPSTPSSPAESPAPESQPESESESVSTEEET